MIKGDDWSVGIPEIPFLTRCDAPLPTRVETDSWQDPGAFVEALAQTPNPPSGCDKLAFEPEISAQATTEQAAVKDHENSPLTITEFPHPLRLPPAAC